MLRSRLRDARRFISSVLAVLSGASLLMGAGPGVDVYTIDTILPLTGVSAYSGQTHLEALRAYEAFANAHGGIRGRPIHFDVHDDQSNPLITVQLTNQILAKNPPVIVGASSVAECAAEAPLLLHRSTVEYCLSPGLLTRQDNVFAASIAITYITPAILKFMRDRGYQRIGLISATDATGQAADALTGVELAKPENANLHVVAWEHFNPADISVTAQIAHLKAQNVQAVNITATGSGFGNVLRSLHDAGLEIPVVTSAVNMNHQQLEQYASFLPKELIFNTTRIGLSRDQLRNGPQRAALDEFYTGFRLAGLTPSPESTSWDPAKIVVAALRAVGPNGTGDQVATYISNLHGFAGASGVYDFRNTDHHGLTDADLVWVKWQPADKSFVAVSRPGGAPLAP
jgi:branched-chain amino acid transport system substrate-binding protein